MRLTAVRAGASRMRTACVQVVLAAKGGNGQWASVARFAVTIPFGRRRVTTALSVGSAALLCTVTVTVAVSPGISTVRSISKTSCSGRICVSAGIASPTTLSTVVLSTIVLSNVTMPSGVLFMASKGLGSVSGSACCCGRGKGAAWIAGVGNCAKPKVRISKK